MSKDKIAVIGWAPGVIDNVEAYLPEVKAPSNYKDPAAIERYIAAAKAKQLDEASENMLTGVVKDYTLCEYDPRTGELTPQKISSSIHVLEELLNYQEVAGWRIFAFLNLMFVSACRSGTVTPACFWARHKPSQNYKQLLMKTTDSYPLVIDPIEMVGDKACRDDLALFLKVWGTPAGYTGLVSNEAADNAKLTTHALSKLFPKPKTKA